jgi:hypothetical protein
MDTTDHETHSSSYHSTSSERTDQVGGRLGRLFYKLTRSNTISCFIFVRRKSALVSQHSLLVDDDGLLSINKNEVTGG